MNSIVAQVVSALTFLHSLGHLSPSAPRLFFVSCQGSSRRNPTKADHRPPNFWC